MLSDALPFRPLEIVVPRQVHSTEVFRIDSSFMSLSAEERSSALEGMDAVMTDIPGMCLCVSTADCIPILLYDSRSKAVAAIHAGWRGTVGMIVTRTLSLMAEAYGTSPEDVHAVIGPGISLLSFEVGDEVYDAFSRSGFNMDMIARRYGKWHIDLWEANRQLLVDAGVKPGNIEVCGICTYTCHDDFFSARRLGINSGRMLTGIMLNL